MFLFKDTTKKAKLIVYARIYWKRTAEFMTFNRRRTGNGGQLLPQCCICPQFLRLSLGPDFTGGFRFLPPARVRIEIKAQGYEPLLFTGLPYDMGLPVTEIGSYIFFIEIGSGRDQAEREASEGGGLQGVQRRDTRNIT